ncbi:TPA: hypothetical protein JLD45_000107 [Escherichia coli]|nr:hypothetical protein [Escherichia coli]HAV8572808.1 hypothetical protein [Escherichia coli]
MKQMSIIEMDGFLKGKCIPRDLKVNETNAEYLARKFGELESKLETALRECRSAGITIDNLEAKCAAMAAENARLRSAVTQQIELRAEIKKAGRPPHADFWVQSICEAEKKVKRALEETPATDAFLAEVRAQGVEMFGQYHNFSEKLFIQKEAQKFAAQLRKGGNQ